MMSKAEELLDSLSNDRAVVLLADSSEEPHIVVDSDRFITVPDELKRIAVQYDHNIETVTFDCPRYWDEHDMSTMNVYINYLRSDGKYGTDHADNVRVDEDVADIMHFEWTITRNVTEVAGKLVFSVCVKKVDEEGVEVIHWNSERNSGTYVSQGLEIGLGGEIDGLVPDALETIVNKVLASLPTYAGETV